MVIVPYQVLETMKWWRDKQYQKPILPPNPQAKDASHLLKDMNQILQKKKKKKKNKKKRLVKGRKGSKVWRNFV